jgi:hypothetical protein
MTAADVREIIELAFKAYRSVNLAAAKPPAR